MTTIIWQYGSSNPENATAVETIRQWWAGLSGEAVNWQQRLLPEDGDLSRVNWETQKFDEVFEITNPQLRGMTLYWYKPDSDQERNLTPSKLELDRLRQQLYIFPQSQPGVVVRVEFPKVQYQMIELNNPDIAVSQTGVMLLRDNQNLIEVKVKLTPESLANLKSNLT